MKLPVVSGVEVVKALSKIGYELDHQTGTLSDAEVSNYPFTTKQPNVNVGHATMYVHREFRVVVFAMLMFAHGILL